MDELGYNEKAFSNQSTNSFQHDMKFTDDLVLKSEMLYHNQNQSESLVPWLLGSSATPCLFP